MITHGMHLCLVGLAALLVRGKGPAAPQLGGSLGASVSAGLLLGAALCVVVPEGFSTFVEAQVGPKGGCCSMLACLDWLQPQLREHAHTHAARTRCCLCTPHDCNIRIWLLACTGL